MALGGICSIFSTQTLFICCSSEKKKRWITCTWNVACKLLNTFSQLFFCRVFSNCMRLISCFHGINSVLTYLSACSFMKQLMLAALWVDERSLRSVCRLPAVANESVVCCDAHRFRADRCRLCSYRCFSESSTPGEMFSARTALCAASHTWRQM